MERKVVVEICYVSNDCPKCDDHRRIYNKAARFCHYCATRLTKRVSMDIEICLEDSVGLDTFVEGLRTEIEGLIEDKLETYMPW